MKISHRFYIWVYKNLKCSKLIIYIFNLSEIILPTTFVIKVIIYDNINIFSLLYKYLWLNKTSVIKLLFASL